ncbi:major facilitator superfamily domain-containing protein [Fusarium oxysporum Fo47]|uniref:major facilitator superfamily domain-containing protein n=1 Tax=Fusarium oxysporum Fo47 TaxID=660027 RepID=UPI0028699DE8|nr:major facilitator superfamily domain-containing protein [Fusarium oxysporum Fo47]WJG34366.1 major facilitator superfamily domain-containing protein [Fusarium oxysporum Fo47]
MYKQRENKTLWAGAFFPDRDPKQTLYPKDQGVRPWLVVLGSFCVMGATFGYVNTFGVFLAYYKTHQLASSSISAINWIGSIQLFCMYFFAPLVGKLFDAGWFRLVFLIGSILHTVGMFALSISTSYVAIFFTQGICQGIGLGLIFLPSQAIISHWFQKRRSLALGLSALGSSVGGVIFPVIMRRLLTSSTFETTVQVIGACTTVCLVVANITLATNQPPAEWNQVHMMDHEALKLRPFVFFTIGSTLVMWGVRLYVPIFYLEAFAQSYHFSPDISYYSLSILNGASLFGRLIPNLLGD